MPNEIYVDPAIATSNVIRVGGVCYIRQGSSEHPPNVNAIDGAFGDCESCNSGVGSSGSSDSQPVCASCVLITYTRHFSPPWPASKTYTVPACLDNLGQFHFPSTHSVFDYISASDPGGNTGRVQISGYYVVEKLDGMFGNYPDVIVDGFPLYSAISVTPVSVCETCPNMDSCPESFVEDGVVLTKDGGIWFGDAIIDASYYRVVEIYCYQSHVNGLERQWRKSVTHYDFNNDEILTSDYYAFVVSDDICPEDVTWIEISVQPWPP